MKNKAIISCFLTFIFFHNLSFSQQTPKQVTYVGQYIIENNKIFNNTVIGGLSGIEKITDNLYYIVSDDYGEYGAPRMYKTKISFNSKGIKQVDFLDVLFLQPPPNKKFCTSPADKLINKDYLYADAEAIRYDKTSNKIVWASEGYLNGMCAQPFIFYADTNGNYLSKFSFDTLFAFDCKQKKGMQHNAAFEALALIPNTNLLVYCSEKCLIQDATKVTDTVNPLRITVADKTLGATMGQYVYMLNNVYENNSNGVTEMVALSSDTFLVLERAYHKLKGVSIRLYQCSATNATDVKKHTQLNSTNYVPVQKQLLFDFSTITGIAIDNIEGMTWGPLINNKTATLLFVSDNNFNNFQQTQVLLFNYSNLK